MIYKTKSGRFFFHDEESGEMEEMEPMESSGVGVELEEELKEKKQRVCGACGRPGHQKRTCPGQKTKKYDRNGEEKDEENFEEPSGFNV